MKGTRQWNERRRAMAEACGYRCWYCGRVVSFDVANARTVDFATIDHQHPRDLGGDDSDENLVIACFSCNSQKHTRTVEEYRDYLRSLDPHAQLATAINAAIAVGVAEHDALIATRVWLLEQVAPVVFFAERVR